ncbi:hypothetical protein F4553_005796 [Allocatelliglobosispora scoriae]|uniref:Tail specific protease domain-containing protein n=1 Tax=Allocatelliglobosispora scoriae TaxID=643052 RepID=A0A841BZY7_9ACTN|nr:S41 family peptidase [Allocatelliglobosispora scoriae]MBB5872362.1 hypothetical protein [Allocatelliglobosispora scoriae]
MPQHEKVSRVIDLVQEHYVFPEIAAEVTGLLRTRLAEGSYTGLADDALAIAITRDLQSANGDKHLRLLHHTDPVPESRGDDESDLTEMRTWADLTAHGVARAERLPGNVGYLDIQPILFPTAVAADAIAAAMTLVAPADALIIDLRGCLGGEVSMTSYFCAFLLGAEPVELSGIFEAATGRVRQLWTPAHVPGRRFGATKPLWLLTSGTTFSGGEAVAYDLQQLGRAVIVGDRTRGGAHPREGFRVAEFLEATIPVARSVSPITGTNWEGTGVTPDVECPADQALEVAYRAALNHVVELGGENGRRQVLDEARAALS